MAKFAQVGYGHDGRGVGQEETGYTYVVNDNVRTGDVIYPSVIHAKSGNLFVTMGRVNNTFKDLESRSDSPLMEKTNELKDAVQDQLGNKGIDTKELAKVVKASDIRGSDRKQILRQGQGTIKPINPAESVFAQKQANLELRQQQTNAPLSKSAEKYAKGETFESYSRKFMNGDEQ